jgi:pimeloyl-ACP methyl ester carboxylesterase
LTIGGSNWVNAGMITAAGATVNLGGSFAVASLGNFSATGGTVNLTGTLNNTGTTLALAPALGNWYLHGGTISGGTVASTGGSNLTLTDSGGTLAGGVTFAAGTTLDGTQNVNGSEDYGYVTGGLTVNGTANLGASNGSTYALLYFQGSQTLAGAGTINFGTSTSNALYAEGNDGSNPSTLTLGSNLQIQGGTETITGYYPNDSIANEAAISVTAGQTLTIGGSNWVNAGMITAAGATVNLGGSFAVASLGNFSAAGGSVNLTGTLNNAGTTLALTSGLGNWYLHGGTISGGTISATGGLKLTLTDSGGTLAGGVTIATGAIVDATQNINGGEDYANVTGGLTLNGALDLGAAGGGTYGQLNFQGGAQTLAGSGKVTLGGSSNNALYAQGNDGSNPVTLTIASGISIMGGSGIVSGQYANDSFVNNGTISIPSGQTLQLGGLNWVNAGEIMANGATINLYGSLAFADLGNFNASGGLVNMHGTLENVSSTLALTPAIGAWRLMGGTIDGGTVTTTGGSVLALTQSGGTLANGVTVAAGATLDASQNINGSEDYASVTGGLTLDGVLNLGAASGGTYGQLNFQDGAQALAGSGTVTLGSSSSNALYAQGNDGSNPVTLTIASGIKITGGSGILSGQYANDSFDNNGTITIPSGQTLQLGGLNWVNAGVITANGATLNLDGSFTAASIGNFNASGGLVNLQGTLNNAGETLALAPGLGAWRLLGGTIRGGTITDTGGSVLALTESGGTLANGVTIAAGATLDATQNIDGSEDYADVTGGLTLNGAANLGAAGGSTFSQLYFRDGSQTLAGSGTVTLGSNANNALYAQGNDGSNPVTLTIGGPIIIQGGDGTVGGYYSNDSVVNDGTISVASGNTLDFGGLNAINSGLIGIAGGTLKAIGTSFTNVAGGLISGYGTLNTSNVTFANNGITDLSAPSILNVNLESTSVTIGYYDSVPLNVATVTNPANYTILGSGGDDIFGNGNDVNESGLISSVSYNSTTQTATLQLSSALPVDFYRVEVNGNSVQDSSGTALYPGMDVVNRVPNLVVPTRTVNWIGGAGTLNWTDAGNWSSGSVPGPLDAVSISAVSGPISIASGAQSIYSLADSSASLTLSGGTLSVAGNLQISSGSVLTLKGGTLANATVASGTTVVLTDSGGTLAGVTISAGATVDATQNINGSEDYAGVTGGLTLNGALNLGAASGSTYGQLDFQDGAQTLAGSGMVTLGSNTTNALYAQGNDGSLPVTLTIANGISLQGGSGTVGGYYSNDSFVNNGNISILSGQTLTIQGSNWDNNGEIAAAGATINLGGSFSTAGLGNFGASGGTVNLTGTLNNSGTTLTLTPTLGNWTLHGGTINGGTIATTGGSKLALTDSGGTLAGNVTIATDATLDATQNINGGEDYALVTGGLTLNGALNLGAASGSTYGQLDFQGGAQTLAGSGTVTFGSNTSNALYARGNDGSLPVTLTIGSGISLQGGSGTVGGYYNNDSLVNDGNISIQSGQALTIQGSNWDNNGQITVAGATVNLGGSFTVAALSNFSATGATVNLTGTLNNTATTLALAPALGNWYLRGGTISGGTVSATGGSKLTLTDSGGTLAGNVTIATGVTLDATQNINGSEDYADVAGGLTLNGALNLGAAGGNTYGQLDFQGGAQTLVGSGTVTFGSNTSNALYAQGNDGSLPVTLTIGSGISLQGGSGTVGGYYGNDSFVNYGTITILSGQTLTIQGSNWDNNGKITATGATVNLGGSFTVAALGNFSATSATVNLTGTLNNTATTLVLAPALGNWYLHGGTINGGTVSTTGGSKLTLTDSGGTLAGDATIATGATLDATQNINGGEDYALVTGGLTLNGALNLGAAGGSTYGQLDFQDGAQTLAGSGTVTFGSNTSNALYAQGNDGSLPVILTIGSGITLQGGSGTLGGYYGNDSFVNDGAITIPGGQTLTIQGSNWDDNGKITATGATVNLGGSFTVAALGTFSATGATVNLTGTLNNTGTTLALASALGNWYLHGGTISGGTVSATGASKLTLTESGGTLAGNVTIATGVTLDATQNINGSEDYAYVTGGLTLNGALNLGAAGGSTYGQLDFQDGAQTLAGSGTVTFGSNTSNALYAQGNDSSLPVTLTIANGISLQGGSGTVGGYYNSDSLVNYATIAIASGQTLTIQGSNWDNNGKITATGATVNLGGSFTVAALGNFSATGATVNLTGTLNNTGTTLALAPALGNWYLHGGTISGGTVSAIGGEKLTLTGSGGTLAGGVTITAGTTLDGTQDVNSSRDLAYVTGGLVLNGTLDLGAANGSTYANLYFENGSQTLSGTSTVTFGSSTSNELDAYGANGAATLILDNGITIQGGSGSIGGYYSTDSIVFLGALTANSSGGNVSIASGGTGTTLNNFTSITAGNGATITVPESLAVDGTSIVSVSASSSLKVAGNLLGTTQNSVLFNPQGTVTLNAAGTLSSPQLLEAISADLGSGSSGFVNNFAYGTLIVGGNDYVKLVNQSINSPGSSAEAVYANSLVVPAGSTLNLNGLNLYVRDAQIAGTITGGSITQIPNSGPLTIDSPTPGHLSTAGELDNWTFFARAGSVITVSLDPGSGAPGGPVSPQLEWAQIQLLGPSNNVLATASNATAGALLTLNSVTVPADGTYTIAIKAAPSHTSNVGNYVVAAFDVTPDIQSLNINQRVTGTVPTPYSTDQWTFSAAANTQVQFDLLATSASGLNFSLTGPNGFNGFTNITGSSTLITLPSSGTYTLTVQGTGGAVGSFAFEMAQTSLTPLTLGSPFNGVFSGNGQPQLFTINVPSVAPLSIQLTDNATADHLELYASLGTPPTRETYDYGANGAGSSQSLLIPNAATGTWYVLAYAESVAAPPANFSISANSGETVVTNFTPNHSGNGADITVTLNGAGFENGTSVAMLSTGGISYSAESENVISFEQMSATFTTGSVPAGQYTLQLTLPDNTLVNAPGTFSVSSGGQSQLVTHIVVPSSIGYHLPSTLYVQYTNAGTIAMPAPLLLLDATQNGQEGAFLSLDSSAANTFFSTSTLPAGYSHSVEILASGATPGVLEPGETVSVPVYYAGWQQPWNFSYPAINFSLKTELETDTTPVNWDDLYYAGINDGSPQTEQTLANIQANLGTTWGDYVNALDQYAANIGEVTGENITDASQLSSILLADATSAPASSPPASAPAVTPSSYFPWVPAAYQGTNQPPEGSIFWWNASTFQWVFVTSPLAITDSVLLNRNLPTVVIIHGLNNDISSSWQAQMAEAIVNADGANAYNILAVDWGVDSFPGRIPIEGVSALWGIPAVSGHITAVSQEVTNELFGSGLNELALAPSATHLIGHSFGAQIAGNIGLDTEDSHYGVVQQITLLDASSDLVNSNNALGWQGKYVAKFVDEYQSSALAGSNRALGNDCFLLTSNSMAFDVSTSIQDEVNAHGYAVTWYICTITPVDSEANPLNFGWNWGPGSWSDATEELSEYTSDSTGAWKGIIYGPMNYLEAFSPGLNTSTYPDEWDYPGPWASTPPDTTAWLQMQVAISNSYEISITSAHVPTYWQSSTDEQVSFTFSNNDVDTIIGGLINYDTYDYTYYLSDTPDLSGQNISLGSDSQVVLNDSKAIGNGGITFSPIVDMASIDDIDTTLGTSGPYYLIIQVEPGGSGKDEYQGNNLYPTKVVIDGQGFSADAGGDKVVPDEGDGNGATVTLDGSKSGPNVVPDSYVWTEGDTVLATGTATCTAHFADGIHKVTLTVTGPDEQQASDTATITVKAGDPQPPFDGPPTTTSKVPVGSHDPNAMEGPTGYGDSNFVALNGAVFPYQIDFENSPSATGPAQDVTITDQLDSNLDWSTFQLTSIVWGNNILSIPAGSQHYQATVPMTYNGETFDVEVEAGIHTSTGQVYATFQSVDPDTELPPDILTGFLPPEDGTGRGMGYVGFTIQPKAGLPTGTQIRNVALITFDENGAIATDQVNDDDPSQGIDPTKEALVTIDSGAPTSTVAALPAVTTVNSFPVSWSGTDDAGGSGVGSYTIYVSDNGGAFTPWLIDTTETSADYVGQDGHTYGFFSVATDNVGNQQSTPSAAQAMTTVDATPPTSSVAVLPDYSAGSFTVSWSGSDSNGIGIADYDIYVSDNGGAFAPWLTNTTQTSAIYSGQNGHTYGFYSIAIDKLGNVQPTPTSARASTVVDSVPPTSSVAALPSFSLGTFTLSWAGSDNTGGSGLASYSIYVSDDGGPFTALLTNTTLTSTTFTGANGQTYGFYSVATDNVGNVQATPASAQASTTVDTSPPTSNVEPLPQFSPASFTVSWSGNDGGGSGIASYDIYVSANGSPFSPLLTNTTLTSTQFAGVVGDTYGFYSVATDELGNVQPTPTAAQASTTAKAVSSTSVGVTIGPNPITFSETATQAVTLTASITSSGGTVDGGFVDFTVAGLGSIDNVPVNNGSAATTFTVAQDTAAGGYTVTANYSGAPLFSVGSGNSTLTVSPASTSTSAGNVSATYSVSSQAVTLDATVTSTAGAVSEGTVTFTVVTTGGQEVNGQVSSGTVTGGNATATFQVPAGESPGAYTIQAAYNPGPDYLDSSSSGAGNGALSISKSSQAITFTAPTSPIVFAPNETVTLRATAPGGTVGFSIDASSTGTGSINGSLLTIIGAGTFILDANQSGNGDYNAAPQVQQTLVVSKAAQAITFTAPASPIVFVPNETVTLSASAPGGTVAFSIDASSTGTGSITGTALTITGAGTFILDANQSGNGNYSAAPQVQQTLVVNKAAQAITFTAPASPIVFAPNQTVTLSATAPGGTVRFSIDASSTGTGSINGSVLTITGAGSFILDANQSGNGNYNAAPQVQQTLVVNKAAQSIAFTAPASPIVFAPNETVTLSAGSSSGGTVAFSIDASSTGTGSITGSVLTITGAGTFILDANQSGNGSYNAAPQVQQTLVVNKAAQSITFAAPASPIVFAPDKTVTLSASSSSGGAVAFSIDASGTGTGSITGSVLTITGAGTFILDANQSGNGDYNAAPQVQQTLVVDKAAQTITFTAPASPIVYVPNETVTLNASSSSAGAVSFSIDASSTGTGSINGSVLTISSAGTFILDANQSGNGNYNPAPQVQQNLVVSAATTITVASNIQTAFSTVAQSVALSAAVTSGGVGVAEGSVTFTVLQGASVVGAPVTSGTLSDGVARASFSLPAGTLPGTYTIEAQFSDSAGNFIGSSNSANPATLSITLAPTTTAVSSVLVAPSAVTQTVPLQATITSTGGAVSGGTVEFTVLNSITPLGTPVISTTVSGGLATAEFTLPAGTPAGTYTVQAAYSGAGDFQPSQPSKNAFVVDAGPSLGPVGGSNEITMSRGEFPDSVPLNASSPANLALSFTTSVVGDSLLNDLEQQYQFQGLGYATYGATAYVLHSNQSGLGSSGYYLIRPGDGALFPYDGSGSYAHSFANGMALATLGSDVYTDPTLLLEAQTPIDYTTLYNLETLHGFTQVGSGYYNFGAAAFVVQATTDNSFNNPYYLIRPADGGVFAYDGSGNYAHTFANVTPIATLGASIYLNPALLLNAGATPSVYAQLFQLNQQYDLQELNGSFYTNTYGNQAEWFYSPILNQFGQHWYTLTPDGNLRAWEGYTDSSVGAVIATLDSSVYSHPTWLTTATALPDPAVTASVDSAGNLSIALPSASYIGTFKVTLTAFDGLLSSSQTVAVTSTGTAPAITVSQGNTTIPQGGSQSFDHGSFPQTDTVATSSVDGETVTSSASVSSYDLPFTLEQRYQFKGLGSYTAGAAAYVLSADANNAYGNPYYLVSSNGSLYPYDGSGSYAHTFTNATPLATLGANYYADPTLLLNAQPAVNYTALYNLMQQYSFTGLGYFTFEATAYVLHSSQPGAGSGGYYLLLPNGNLYAYDGSGSYAHTIANSANLLTSLDPSIYSEPSLLLNAQAAPGLYAQLAQVELQYDLKGLGYSTYGAPAYVLTAPSNNANGNPYYLLNSNGNLYAYDGSGSYAHTFATSANLIATLDPSVFTIPTLLTNAKSPEATTGVTATLSNGTLTLNAPPSFVGTFQVTLTASDGALTETQSFQVTSTDAPPVPGTVTPLTVSQSGAPVQVTLSSTAANNDAVTYTASVAGFSAAYNLQQQYNFKGVGYVSTPDGVTAYVLSIMGSNANGNPYYLITSTGGVYAYDGSGSFAHAIANSANLITTLSPSVYNNPTLLTAATAPAAPAALVSVSANTLTVNVAGVSPGTVFEVFVTANDGAETTRTGFLVTVSA